MTQADVVVVGGGPAGAAAAIALARAGRDVMIVDRARFPRDKCCGDGLTASALRQLEALGLRPEMVPSWQRVDDVWLQGPSAEPVRFPLPRARGTYAAVAPRRELDAALLEVARATGARVHEGSAVTSAENTGDGGIRLEVEGLGPVTAHYAIGADGAWSPLRKALQAGPARYLGDWHAFRQYFSGVGPAAADLWVWFEPDLLPGYAWSFPLPGGRANVGFGVVRRADTPTGYLKELWPRLLARPTLRAVLGPDAVAEGTHRAWPIPARIDDVQLTKGRALFVGDAAAATDPLTGEGIGQALLTGRLAAEAVLAAGAYRPTVAAGHYRKAVQRQLVVDHRLSRLLTRATTHRRGVRSALGLAGRSPWTRGNFARWLFEDYPRALVITPGRWQRGALRGGGAYAGGEGGTG